jgi:HEAT repeat protein
MLFSRTTSLRYGLAILLTAIMLGPSIDAAEIPPQAKLDRKRVASIADGEIRAAAEMLYSAVPAVRVDGLHRLNAISKRCEPALPWLIAALGDEQWDGDWGPAYRSAEQVLAKMAPASEAAVIAALRDERANIRERAARLLGTVKSRAAIEPLLALVRDADNTEAWGAIEALGELQVAEAVPALVNRLKSPHFETRRAAVNVLGRLKDERAVEPLLKLAAGPSWKLALPGEAATALYQIGGPGFEAAQKLFNHSDPRVRSAALGAASQTRDPRLIDSILAGLDDEYTNSQSAAVSALDWIVEHRGLDVAAAAFARKEATYSVRQESLRVLVKHDHPELVQFLREGLADKNIDVRQTAVYWIRQKPDRQLADDLINVLSEKTPATNGIRSDAAEILGELGDMDFVAPLLMALADPSEIVRASAAASLGKIGDARAIEPLLGQLQTGDYFTRNAAARALGTFDDPRVAPALIAAAAREKGRLSVILALERVRGPKVLETLIAALRDKDHNVASGAQRVLAKRTDPDADDLLHQAAREGDDRLRERIERILLERRAAFGVR